MFAVFGELPWQSRANRFEKKKVALRMLREENILFSGCRLIDVREMRNVTKTSERKYTQIMSGTQIPSR